MLVTAAILYAVLTPNPPAPEGLVLFEGADKVVHAVMMGTLVAAALVDLQRGGMGRRRPVASRALVVAWVMAFGVLTELMQSALTDNRTADIADVGGDWAGTLLVGLPIAIFQINKLKKP